MGAPACRPVMLRSDCLCFTLRSACRLREEALQLPPLGQLLTGSSGFNESLSMTDQLVTSGRRLAVPGQRRPGQCPHGSFSMTTHSLGAASHAERHSTWSKEAWQAPTWAADSSLKGSTIKGLRAQGCLPSRVSTRAKPETTVPAHSHSHKLWGMLGHLLPWCPDQGQEKLSGCHISKAPL